MGLTESRLTHSTYSTFLDLCSFGDVPGFSPSRDSIKKIAHLFVLNPMYPSTPGSAQPQLQLCYYTHLLRSHNRRKVAPPFPLQMVCFQ